MGDTPAHALTIKWETRGDVGVSKRHGHLRAERKSESHSTTICATQNAIYTPPSRQQLITGRAHYTQTNAQTWLCPNAASLGNAHTSGQGKDVRKSWQKGMSTVVQWILQINGLLNDMGATWRRFRVLPWHSDKEEIYLTAGCGNSPETTPCYQTPPLWGIRERRLSKVKPGRGEKRQGKGGVAGETAVLRVTKGTLG